MKKILLITFCMILLFSCNQGQNDYLIKIKDKNSFKSGYIDTKGDTIIPLGKYFDCLLDTITKIAIVREKMDSPLIGINRKEQKLFEIFLFPNSKNKNYPDDGLILITENDKIGYADMNGKIIIIPKYECAGPFKNGKAFVADSCKEKIYNDHIDLESDNWYEIDGKGNRIKN